MFPTHILEKRLEKRQGLEIAIASLDDALAAQPGGADRLEINAALTLGGLALPLGTLLEIKRAVVLPVTAMPRPQGGGFAYSEADFRVMPRDTDLALAQGADGMVFGNLTSVGPVGSQR